MPRELNFDPVGNKEGQATKGSHTARRRVQESSQGRAVGGQTTYAAAEAPPAADGFLLLDPSGTVVAASAVVRRILGYPSYPEGRQRRFELELRNTVSKLLDPSAPLERWSLIRLVLNGRRCQCWGIAVELVDGERLLAVLVQRGLSTAPSLTTLRNEQPLTPREQEMVVLLAKGFTNKEIATRMRVSVNTVKAFLHSVMLKVGATTRAGIVGRLNPDVP